MPGKQGQGAGEGRQLTRSMVYSDEHAAYDPFQSMGYQHRRVHHAAKVYVQGDAHTNTYRRILELSEEGEWRGKLRCQ